MTHRPNMQAGYRHALAYCATREGQSLSFSAREYERACEDSAYCLDAPEALPAGSTIRGDYTDTPAARITYRA